MGAIAEAFAGAAGGIVNSLYSMYRNKVIDAREDNAIRRRAEDLRKAGFNPLLAASGNGAGASQGLSTSFDTSGLSNISQTAYDIKNQRETYKQNQLYTQLMKNQLRQSNFDTSLSELQSYALYGHGFDRGSNFGYFDKRGNFKIPSVSSHLNLYDSDLRDQYFNSQEQALIDSLRNQFKFDFNQSLFNLKTQGYQNGLNIAKDTLEPLLQIGSLLNPIGNFYGNVFGRKNFNQSQFSGTWNSRNENYNYNYKR